MKISMLCRVLLTLIVLGSLVLSSPRQAKGNDGVLNVLTINLLFSEVENRNTRLETIANFVTSYPEPIDLILLQEVVGGAISNTANSALDLKNKLAAKGLDYNLSYRMANGFPGLLTVGNAILSLHEILFTVATSLPFESEEIFQGVEIPLKRNAMMSRIKVSRFEKVNVYNTHLCAYCDPQERLEQTKVLMKFIQTMEMLTFGTNPIILGGDFNIVDALIWSDLAPEYDLIVSKGFMDSYAMAHNCVSCCQEEDSAKTGCTFAVEDNPYAINLFTGEPEESVRIDYIFVKNVSGIVSSEVVLNQDPWWVSDHSALLTKIRLP